MAENLRIFAKRFNNFIFMNNKFKIYLMLLFMTSISFAQNQKANDSTISNIELTKSQIDRLIEIDKKISQLKDEDKLVDLQDEKYVILNSNNDFYHNELKKFLNKYPFYNENLDKFYFEISGYSPRGSYYEYYFRVYNLVEVTSSPSNNIRYVSIKSGRNVVDGKTQFILFPTVHNNTSLIGNIPPKSVDTSIKYVVHGPYGLETIPSYYLRK